MSEFDARAREWDNDRMHMDRSGAIATELEKRIPADRPLRALEYGAGSGILSFLLRDKFSEIVLMDNSKEMIRVCEEKAAYFRTSHIKPLWFNLEHNDFDGKFDIIYNQMVLHHVNDIDTILNKFNALLNPGGLLAIADLYPEDGSFHGPDVKVHLGFDPAMLIETLKQKGFNHSENKTCFVIKRPTTGREYPVFLLVAEK
jgi:2-polyprenyl-3-methyl-5-hydroxy-6-metoxy-1,4-benzoquinol methylase